VKVFFLKKKKAFI